VKAYPSAVVAAFRRFMLRGALVLLPLAITLMVIKFALGLSDSLVGSLADWVSVHVMPNSTIRDVLTNTPGLSLLFLLLVFVLVGAIASTGFGKAGVRGVDWVFQRIPLARAVYSAARRTVDLFGGGGNNARMFQRCVWLDIYPGGARVLGFVVKATVDSTSRQTFLVVAIPGKPNPTGVTVVTVPEKNTTAADISPEEALRWGMTIGMLTPAETRITG
jgi:uncharacterized membrane protein